MNLAGYEIDDAIPLPVRRDRGIGIVGCGGIVNYAHLPAYQASGFRVVACHDRDMTAADTNRGGPRHPESCCHPRRPAGG